MLNFMDAYSRYKQIWMELMDEHKTTFMSNHGKYFYNVMPFSLKNNSATCQRLKYVVFAHQVGKILEVYVSDIIVKTIEGNNHAEDLKDVLQLVRKYDMCLNSSNFSFGVQARKFLGFMLTRRGIEDNPNKFQGFITMRSPINVNKVQHLTGRLAVLSHFLSCAVMLSSHKCTTMTSSKIRWNPYGYGYDYWFFS